MNSITGRVTSLSPFMVARAIQGRDPNARGVLASSFGTFGFMILGMSLMTISILRLRRNNQH